MPDKKIGPNDEIPPHLMENYAALIASLTQGRGFVLVISPLVPDLPTQYVSNLDRKDAHDMIERMCAKWRTQS